MLQKLKSFEVISNRLSGYPLASLSILFKRRKFFKETYRAIRSLGTGGLGGATVGNEALLVIQKAVLEALIEEGSRRAWSLFAEINISCTGFKDHDACYWTP